jgi:hypothetical protein
LELQFVYIGCRLGEKFTEHGWHWQEASAG